MTTAPPSSSIPVTTSPPTAASSELSEASNASAQPLTLESLGAKVDLIANAVVSMQTAWAGLLQAPPPPPFPAPPLPPPPVPTAPIPTAPATSYPYGMPSTGAGVPLHLLQWPASPSPLPDWLQPSVTASAPLYSIATSTTPSPSTTIATTAVPTLPSAGGPLSGGVDGSLFFGAPSSSGGQQQGGLDPGLGAALASAQAGPKFYKLEFPTYDGSADPLNWLNQCEQFFRGQQTLASARTWLASYHLRGAAQTWYYALEQDEGMPPWERFRELCSLRFGPPVLGTRLAELARLPFGSSVQDYSERYNAILCHARNLSARQKAELYVGGLPDQLRKQVQLRAPPDLQTAMYLARAFEDCVSPPAPQPRGARPPLRSTWTPQQRTPSGPPPAAAAPTPTPAPTFRRLSPDEQQERRRQGLCFNCDEPYVRGHVCKRLFYLEVDDYIVETPVEATEDTPSSELAGPEMAAANALVVSLQAVAGIRAANSMLLPVVFKGERFLALLDTGSTHNFVSGETMRRLGLVPAGGERLRITVANGDRMPCEGIARNVPIRIYDEDFAITCVGLNLGGFDFIMGFDFIRTLGPILWDCEALTLSFWRDGRRVTWQGVAGAVAPSPAPSAQLLAAAAPNPWQPLLDVLLQQHAVVFTEPTGLPPARAYDHRIHLLPGTTSVAVRPYRYPQLQKDELERQCAAMLTQGIIRPTTSPFSAPVLLVRKADQSWRFCIDYRALNAKTSKDKFPIPVVDELLDEIHGARFFTKLDLRSGYHQVRMHPDDIAKTAFRTHHGHFEFLVMPFGLSNAPATFQALMNDVLRTYLGRFVLVFFDDILIYSSSWSEHLQHINIVLSALRAHHLYLKRSKCSFGAPSVTYLGHVIAEGSVAMDADKVDAVAAWPLPRSARGLRGFLGLAGYYRKFIRDFGIIAAPLTLLLR